MSKTDDANSIQIHIAHSQSSKNKVWVTIVMPDEQGEMSEFAVGFDENDCNKILQVNDSYWEDMSEEERDEPMISEAQAVLALSCYYPVQFVPEPETHELLTFLEDMPTKFIAAKHIEKVFKQHSNMTRWQMYENIALFEKKGKSSGPAHSSKSSKPGTKNVKGKTVRDDKEERQSRHSHSDSEHSQDSRDSRDYDRSDSYDESDDAHEYSASDMDADEERQYEASGSESYE